MVVVQQGTSCSRPAKSLATRELSQWTLPVVVWWVTLGGRVSAQASRETNGTLHEARQVSEANYSN